MVNDSNPEVLQKTAIIEAEALALSRVPQVINSGSDIGGRPSTSLK
jgi:hypothetical protein